MVSDPISTLSEDDSWKVLEENEFGRLAYAIGGEAYIVPINYVARDKRIVFRTAEGNKMFGVTMNSSVAFEIDDVHRDSGEATSVIVRGRARVLEGHEAEAADTLPLRTWVPTLKFNIVAIEVDEISGRRFALGSEPERY